MAMDAAQNESKHIIHIIYIRICCKKSLKPRTVSMDAKDLLTNIPGNACSKMSNNEFCPHTLEGYESMLTSSPSLHHRFPWKLMHRLWGKQVLHKDFVICLVGPSINEPMSNPAR